MDVHDPRGARRPLHHRIGDRARAVEWIRACLAVRPMFTAAWLRLDPTFAPLRGDPAFERALAEAP